MPTRIDAPATAAAMARLIAFARSEGWELVASEGVLPSLRKPGLPTIHLGAPGTCVHVAEGAAPLAERHAASQADTPRST
ncbi:hypothetical protein ACQR5S_20075 [Xanthomonas oryzae pv. oryzicola]|uniref:hypothetical protein n=1 Tax=Xanthomonas oryzae TaxID=347 RepID=UPI0010338C88|nr:hypothetical protein [Xanthomonas oryzae]QBH01345.1 hypothetical protein EYC56_21360 [Xanthomonas oryzae]